jgi:tRNA (guanine37-N1)-methyltransferase
MGRIVGPFGVHGWLKVKAFTEKPEGLGEFPRWLVGARGGWREMALEDFEVHSKGPVAKLAGCDDREGAEKLRGCDVAVRRAQLREPDDGTMYWVDLVGLEVVDGSGSILGKVEALFETGDTSVMVVRESQAGAERMIPFIPQYVKSIDRQAKRITVDWKAVSRNGITRRALEEKLFEMKTWDPRDFTTDNYRRVDDRPYGGGPGMVMMAEPLQACIEAATARQRAAGVERPMVVLMSPQGERLDEALVRSLAAEPGLVLIAGRYEGVDERVVAKSVHREVSIGDYVTSGGELPAMVLIDCLVRRMPGSLNDAESASQDSFSAGMLDWPHYTRPEKWSEARVPEVLVSGNHAAIARWRRKQALGRTWDRRPDLLDEAKLSREDRQLLEEYRREQQAQQQQQ